MFRMQTDRPTMSDNARRTLFECDGMLRGLMPAAATVALAGYGVYQRLRWDFVLSDELVGLFRD
jgi:hypothetical protein